MKRLGRCNSLLKLGDVPPGYRVPALLVEIEQASQRGG
jgi:hypothetical protein